jgi:hypothetical protein
MQSSATGTIQAEKRRERSAALLGNLAGSLVIGSIAAFRRSLLLSFGTVSANNGRALKAKETTLGREIA